MSTHTYKKFEDSDSGSLPDKMTVFQECIRTFNASPVDAKKSRLLISRLLRLLYNGETFPKQEATSLFFSTSKLFQHRDSSLRQIVYLAIKELSAISDDVLMVTSSIMRDVQNGDPVYKPNAIRTLARVLEESTVYASERLMKNAIVDKNSSNCSAALVSSFHLLPIGKEVVKRWTNETQEAVLAHKFFSQTSDSSAPTENRMTQYHALGLLYALKSHDKMALRKLIKFYHDTYELYSPLALCQLINFIQEILEIDHSLTDTYFPMLDVWLTHRYPAVNLEAAKVITSLPFTDEQFGRAVSRLQFLLTSSNVVTKFAAVRILNRISVKTPEKIASVNTELESLITDSNISVATYAITTLLKTGSSENIEGLIKNISKFINNISDEFKIVIIDSVRTLSIKFPEKYQTILHFLIEVINDDGGFDFKNAVVEALFDLVHFVEDSRDLALENLCEFIEDCEFTELSVRILNLLGNEGPKTSNPTLYIRHIYNRVVLENSIVRSAAVVALSKFALIDSSINKSVKILLKRIVNDADDEVRDRSIISLRFLESLETKEATKEEVVELTRPSLFYDLPSLETKLQMYITGDPEKFITPFDISSVPKYTEDQLRADKLKKIQKKLDAQVQQEEVSSSVVNSDLQDSQTAELTRQKHLQELSSIEEFSTYGAVLHSSKAIALTDKETEFVVEAVKHIFKEHIVIQFSIENTLDDNLLEMVSVVAQPEDENLTEDFIIPISKLDPHSQGVVYVSFSTPENNIFSTSFSNTLSFVTKECDPTTFEPFSDEGFQDEYEIEDLALTPGDYLIPTYIGNFDVTFKELRYEEDAMFKAGSDSIQEAVNDIIEQLSLQPVEGRTAVSENKHVLKLFGKNFSGERVAAVLTFIKSESSGVVVKTQVKSENEDFAHGVCEGIVSV